MTPIPVLLTIRELGLGGSERQMTEMAKALRHFGFQPHVGCFRPGGIRGDELRAARIPIAEFPVHSFKSWSVVRGARGLLRYLRRHGIRLVHSFDYPLNVFSAPVARLFSDVVVVTSQRAHRELTPGIYGPLQRATDYLAHGIVVNCNYLKEHLIADYRVPAGRIHLCYNGIDLEYFTPGGEIRRPAEFPSDALVVGVACALRPEKGLATLLDAFAKLSFPGKRKLLCVGSGPMLGSLREQAKRLAIEGDVFFEPATADIAPWLRGIDIFVLPSLSEALSNSLMEAMACGCAVIASNTGGNPELVEDGERGLLFPPNDAAALAAALDLLLADEPLRRRLGGSGARFLAGFSHMRAAARLAEIYRSLLGER